MHHATRRAAALLIALLSAGCGEQTFEERVSETIAALKIDNTGIDEQGRPRVAVEPAPPEPVKVEPPSPAQLRFSEYIAGAGHARRLVEAAITNDAYLGRDCPSPYAAKALDVLHQPDPPLAMPETAEHPMQGIWRQRYEVERCGEKLIYNAIFGARPDAAPNRQHQRR
jgi:hypothetical protein